MERHAIKALAPSVAAAPVQKDFAEWLARAPPVRYAVKGVAQTVLAALLATTVLVQNVEGGHAQRGPAEDLAMKFHVADVINGSMTTSTAIGVFLPVIKKEPIKIVIEIDTGNYAAMGLPLA